MVTVKEAAYCPKCNELGIVVANKKLANGDDLTTYHCENRLCRWYRTGWVVQSDTNGHVAEREHGARGLDKDFPHMTPGQLARGRAAAEETLGKEIQ